MGQKSHPYGLRLGYIKPWRAKWFARKNLDVLLHEDLKIRSFIKKKLGFAGISNIEIERSSKRIRVRIFTARPGVIIGRRGQEIDKVKEDLGILTSSELFVDIKEVKSPQTDAQLIAENIAMQLEKRINFRRAMKKALQSAMARDVKGVKIMCKGRLGGAEIAREEKYHEGSIPLGTFRADVDYGFHEAFTTYGSIGIKVWVYKGDILVKKEAATLRLERERKQAERWKEENAAAEVKAEQSTAVAVDEKPVEPAPAPEKETGES